MCSATARMATILAGRFAKKSICTMKLLPFLDLAIGRRLPACTLWDCQFLGNLSHRSATGHCFGSAKGLFMKFAPAIFLPVLGGLLASCCCQEHVSHRSGRPSTTRVAPQPAVVIPQVDEQEANIVLVLGPQNPLPVSLRNQEGYYSCWATCAEM